jgi:hypothetical protein
MGVPLPICKMEEQMDMVHFLWTENVKGVKIHMCLSAPYRDNVLSQQNVYERNEMLRIARQL